MCTFLWLVSFICSCYVTELGFRCRLANCFPSIYYLFCYNKCSLGFKFFPHSLCPRHPYIMTGYRILFINAFLKNKQRHTNGKTPMEELFFTSRCDSLISEFTLKEKSLMFSLLRDNNSVRVRFDQIMIR